MVRGVKHGYRIPKAGVFDPIKIEPFPVAERIGSLAYRLKLPKWVGKMHLILSFIHLEPAPSTEDPFQRPKPKLKKQSTPIMFQGHKYYKIDTVLDMELRGTKKWY